MKISVSLGEDGMVAFESVIEAGVVTGLSLDGCTLTFDYTGLDADAAIARGVENYRAVAQATGDLAQGGKDVEAQQMFYASGYIAVATQQLANEQKQGAAAPIAADVVNVEVVDTAEDEAREAHDVAEQVTKRRSRNKDADTTTA